MLVCCNSPALVVHSGSVSGADQMQYFYFFCYKYGNKSVKTSLMLQLCSCTHNCKNTVKERGCIMVCTQIFLLYRCLRVVNV